MAEGEQRNAFPETPVIFRVVGNKVNIPVLFARSSHYLAWQSATMTSWEFSPGLRWTAADLLARPSHPTLAGLRLPCDGLKCGCLPRSRHQGIAGPLRATILCRCNLKGPVIMYIGLVGRPLTERYCSTISGCAVVGTGGPKRPLHHTCTVHVSILSLAAGRSWYEG